MTRTCSCCKRELPLDGEHFYFRGQSSTGRLIYDYRCHKCRNIIQGMYKRRNRARQNARRRQWRAEMLAFPDLDKAFRDKHAARMRASRKKQKEETLLSVRTGNGTGPNARSPSP
jgi:hypothetical protein